MNTVLALLTTILLLTPLTALPVPNTVLRQQGIVQIEVPFPDAPPSTTETTATTTSPTPESSIPSSSQPATLSPPPIVFEVQQRQPPRPNTPGQATIEPIATDDDFLGEEPSESPEESMSPEAEITEDPLFLQDKADEEIVQIDIVETPRAVETEPIVASSPAPAELTLVRASPVPLEPSAVPAPVEPSSAPVEPSSAPVETLSAPAEPSSAPVEPTPAPVEPTPAPVEASPAAVEASPVSEAATEPATTSGGSNSEKDQKMNTLRDQFMTFLEKRG